jgi:hypothetical protein
MPYGASTSRASSGRGDGTWCHVLTLVDAYSRFLLRAEVLIEPTGKNVERILDGAFQEFGLPTAMRSDNGPPFASTGAGGLTELSTWWLRLGLRLERIQPGKPYQNGRLERLHLTLEEVVGTPSANPRAQQRAIDLWRRDYNEIRPHEALSDRDLHALTSPLPLQAHRFSRHFARGPAGCLPSRQARASSLERPVDPYLERAGVRVRRDRERERQLDEACCYLRRTAAWDFRPRAPRPRVSRPSSPAA